MKSLLIATLVLLTVTAQAQVSPPSNQSRVAGRFVAANYGQWYVNITSAPASTGTATFAVSSSTIALSDGRQFMPFSTNAPIKVGTETVTPSAVGAGCRLGAASGACVLTATFSSTHTTADTVAPATFGLQEALDDAGSAGGGAVTIDQAWVALGGTTGIKNAATLPSNTGIEDIRTGASSGGGTTTNALTMNNGGSGAASGTTFDGSVARTISYNTLGAAPLASPTFTGTPAAPTAAPGTNTTQLATTAFVQAAAGGGGNYVNITASLTPTNCTVTSGVCTTTGNVASVTLAAIPGTYRHLRIIVNGAQTDGSPQQCYIQFNGDSTSGNYKWVALDNSSTNTTNGTGALVGTMTSTSQTGFAAMSKIEIADYAQTTWNKETLFESSYYNSGGHTYTGASWWTSTAAITSILYFPSTGNVGTGTSFTVYGEN